jgi:hypothetical protein
MELDQEIKNLSLDWAERVYNSIYMALTHPDRSISGIELKIYEEFKAWGFFEKFPLTGDEDNEASHQFFIMILARERYNKLKNEKENPSPKKPSKWEVVTGKVPKR